MAVDQLNPCSERSPIPPAARSSRGSPRATRASPSSPRRSHVAAGDLAAPQGARAGRAHLAQPAGDRPAQPPRGGAAARGDRWLAGYREYWDESFERLDELLAALQAGGRPIAIADRTIREGAHHGRDRDHR